MMGQPIGEVLGVLAMFLHAQGQRLDATQGGGSRSKGPGRFRREAFWWNFTWVTRSFLPTRQPPHDIGVSAEVLRGAVQHQIGTEVQGFVCR